MASLRATAVRITRNSFETSQSHSGSLLRCSSHPKLAANLAASFRGSSSPHGVFLPQSSYLSLRTYSASQCRHLSSTSARSAESPENSKEQSEPKTQTSLASLSRALGLGDTGQSGFASKSLEEYTPGYQPPGEHHLYVYAHKHNTHLTLSAPQYLHPTTNKLRQEVLLNLSTGNIGYKKAARGTYEAGYQLGSYVMNRIQIDGLLPKIQRLEVVLRGFGQGREAVIKLLLGQEGAGLRDRVVRVVDASRVKMGGQRAKKPRRLG